MNSGLGKIQLLPVLWDLLSLPSMRLNCKIVLCQLSFVPEIGEVMV